MPAMLHIASTTLYSVKHEHLTCCCLFSKAHLAAFGFQCKRKEGGRPWHTSGAPSCRCCTAGPREALRPAPSRHRCPQAICHGSCHSRTRPGGSGRWPRPSLPAQGTSKTCMQPQIAALRESGVRTCTWLLSQCLPCTALQEGHRCLVAVQDWAEKQRGEHPWSSVSQK